MVNALTLAIDALLEFRLKDWNGLPDCTTSDIEQRLGAPIRIDNAYLGAYPAVMTEYPVLESAAKGLRVYSRSGQVVAIESNNPPSAAALSTLEQPDVRRLGEFSLPGYLVREYLYCRRGLILSVAGTLTPAMTQSMKVVRCRGIAPLVAPQEYDARYYLAQQSRLVFGAHEK